MTTTSSPALWTPPARVRGTLALVTGRGERAGVAAALVQWLERLRGGDVHARVVRTHETAAVAAA